MNICENNFYILKMISEEIFDYSKNNMTHQQILEEETREKERVAFASIDWHDFSIAETIEFGPSDLNVDLPKPFNPHKIAHLSFVQRRELWNEQLFSTETSRSYNANGEADGTRVVINIPLINEDES